MNKMFFERQCELTTKYDEYVKKYNQILNKNTILNFFTSKKKLFEFNEYQYYLKYIFSILKNFIYENEYFSEKYIRSLKKILRWFNLEKELNNVEKKYIFQIESLVFDKSRNLKSLSPEFALIKKNIWKFKKYENIYYEYKNIKWNFGNQKEISGNCFFGKTKLVFLENPNLFIIDFKKIKFHKIIFPNKLIIIAYDKKITITSSEIINIYSSFERLFYAR